MRRFLRCLHPHTNGDGASSTVSPKRRQLDGVLPAPVQQSDEQPGLPEQETQGSQTACVCDSPSELAQVLHSGQSDDIPDGATAEQVQASWARDQSALLGSLAVTTQAVETHLVANGVQLPERAALSSEPEDFSQRQAIAQADTSNTELSEAGSAADVTRPVADARQAPAAEELPVQSEVVRWLARRNAELSAVRELVDGACVLTAEKHLNHLMESASMTALDLQPHAQALGFDAVEVLHDASEVRESLRELRDDTGWTVASNNELRVLYRHDKHAGIHSVKLISTLDCSLDKVLSLAAEYDLISTWNKYILDAIVLCAPSIFDSTVYSATWLPFPFSQMDLLVRGRGFDLGEEEHCLLVSLADGPAVLPPGAQPLPAAAKKRRRVSIRPRSCFTLEELPPGPDGQRRTRGIIVGHCNPHMYVPPILISWVLKIFSPFAFKQCKQLVATSFGNPASVFERRIAEKPAFYGRVRATVDRYMERLYGIAPPLA